MFSRLGWSAATLLAGFTYLWRLGVPSWHRDEYVYASAGRRWLAGHADYNLEHPPVGKYLIGASEAIFGHSATGARLAAVTAALATGVCLALIARRRAGDGAAMVAFVAWVALPHPTPGLRVDRLALLDVFAAAFATAALLQGLRLSDRGRGSWRLSCGIGALVGLAAASKVVGALVLVPIAGLVLASLRPFRAAALRVGAIAVVGTTTFLATYLPLDVGVGTALRTMWDYQRHESAIGFPLRIAGVVYQHPPWWSPFWFAWDRGPLMAIATALAGVCALIWLPRVIALYLGGAVAVSVGAVVIGHGRYFEHYAYAWAPVTTLLASLGLVAVWQRSRIGAGALAAVFVATAVISLGGIATLRTSDYALAGRMLRATTARTVLVAGPRTSFLGEVCPGVTVTQARGAEVPTDYDAIILDPEAFAPSVAAPASYRLLRADRLTVLIRRSLTPTRGC